MRKYVAVASAILTVVAIAWSCSTNDVGTTCQLTIGGPMCDTNIAEKNVASDCSGSWCLSYRGSRPYCSKVCSGTDDCSSGYMCLRQNFSPLDPTLNGLFFCVPKSSVTCDQDVDCNPGCSSPSCMQFYCDINKTCKPNSCKIETDGGTPDAGGGDI
ncbi:MAG: hypothetical protein WC889_19830 [Myxococcota bacterium]|jgi:hypothetical protein